MLHAARVFKALKRDPTGREAWVGKHNLCPTRILCFSHELFTSPGPLWWLNLTLGNSAPQGRKNNTHATSIRLPNLSRSFQRHLMFAHFWDPEWPTSKKKSWSLKSWSSNANTFSERSMTNSWSSNDQWKTYDLRAERACGGMFGVSAREYARFWMVLYF